MSVLSMTGYASLQHEVEGGSISLEVRAVNHRYLDLQFRLPEELRFLEPSLREAVSQKMTRGKVECRLGYQVDKSKTSSFCLQPEVLTSLLAVAQEAATYAPTSVQPLSLAEILKWPGVLAESGNKISPEVIAQSMGELVPQLFADFSASRLREGARLAMFILERVTLMEGLIREVAPKIPKLLKAYQAKLSGRLRDAVQHPDHERLQQEFALFAAKIDIDEEIGRLETHLVEVRRILNKGGAVGKRLDFMMQELNREANTLGSKSISVEISQTSMELKILIEQMREQVQNIE